jgi:hypothetical protein
MSDAKSGKTKPRLFHTVRQIAERWQCSEKTVRRTIARGDLVAHNLSGLQRVSDADLTACERAAPKMRSGTVSISVHNCSMFSMPCGGVGKTCRHKRVAFVMVQFPDPGAESTGVLPRPRSIRHGDPDDDQV